MIRPALISLVARLSRLRKPNKGSVMRLNVASSYPAPRTHEGAIASRNTPYQELRRSVLSCLLWEDTFYESGESIAQRIMKNALIVDPFALAHLAIEARQSFHLRHVPLLLLTALFKTGRTIPRLTRDTIEAVISRPDEMAELIALYWKDGKKPIPYSVHKGLRQAAHKFDAFQLNKWDRDGDIKLRDVAFLSHLSFPDMERASLMANAVNKSFFPDETKGGFRVIRELALWGKAPHRETPETWEALIAAAGSNKQVRKDTWEDLLKRNLRRGSGGFGYMAVLRNLRNMAQDGVNHQLIENVIEARIGARRVLPFRFIQAAKVEPQFFRALDNALKASVVSQEGLPGNTAVCVDCSGSMQSKLSVKSEVTRFDAAAALAGCINGRMRLIAFGVTAKEVIPVQGMGCAHVLQNSGVGHATNAHLAVDIANKMNPDRIIVITDEQVTRALPKPKNGYIINVAPYKNGIGYGDWTKIDGFSPATLDYIREMEAA